LEVNTRWKVLAELYTIDSFAPLWNPLHRSLSSKILLKIAVLFANFRRIFARFCRLLLNLKFWPNLPDILQNYSTLNAIEFLVVKIFLIVVINCSILKLNLNAEYFLNFD